MRDSDRSGNAEGKKRRSLLSTLAPWLVVVAGILLLARPVFMDWYYAWTEGQQISAIVAAYDDMDDPERLQSLAQARAYNARLAGLPYEEPQGGIWDYDAQLTYRANSAGMASYIDIPRISARFAIYHGTDEASLMVGVGHADWSALPVGGPGTRCVLTGHSGMTNSRMFDDIRALEVGDQFVIWTLNEPYAYEVCEIETVLPEEATERCKAQEGRDLATLITCTPYAINTHRLLVTGERCEYTGQQTPGIEAYVNRRTIPSIIGLAVLLLLLLLLILGLIRRKRKNRDEEEDEGV